MNRDKIKVLSLLSGQDIIGEVTQNAETYYVEKPLAVVANPGGGGKLGLGLMAWPILADPESVKKNGVHVNKLGVLTVNDPINDLLQGYMQSQTGLALPAKPTLITE